MQPSIEPAIVSAFYGTASQLAEKLVVGQFQSALKGHDFGRAAMA
jgi:hypothetical protein